MAHPRFHRSRLASLWLSAFAVSAVSAGCGGSASAPAAAPSAPSTATVIEPAPELTEVPEPADLVALARWNNPEASAAAVQSWTGLPLSLRELTKELPAWVSAMTSSSSSADFVLTLASGSATSEPSFHGALAIGLEAPIEDAKQAALSSGEQVEKQKPGVYRLENRIGDFVCSLSASAGPSPSRLVCGEDAGDVDLLMPYMTRTLPRQAIADGYLSAEIRLVPFQKRYAATLEQGLRMGASVLPSQLHIGQPRFDRALSDSVYALADEALALSTDLDALLLGLSFQPEGARSSFALKFRGAKSWTVETLKDAGTRAAAAPPMFWRLPADSTSASFSRGASATRFSGLRQTLGTLLDGWLTHEGVKPADRKALTELFSDEHASDAPTVAANGPYSAATRAAILGDGKDPKALAVREQIASSGWHLFGMEEPAGKKLSLLRNLVTAYNGAALQKQIQRGLEALDITMPLPRVKLANAPKTLPQGSLELTVTLFPETEKAKKPAPGIPLYAFVMPEGGRTWVAMGAEREALMARLRAVQASAPEEGTLASRPGLERLKSGAFQSAGFLTAGGLLHSLESSASKVLAREGVKKETIQGVLKSIPRDGGAPIVFESSVADRTGAPTWATDLDIPKQAVADTVAAIMQAVMKHEAMGLMRGKSDSATTRPRN